MTIADVNPALLALDQYPVTHIELAGFIRLVVSETTDSVNITGGFIDGTVIGGTTPAAGAFTTLSSTTTTSVGTALTVGTSLTFAKELAHTITIATSTTTNTVGAALSVSSATGVGSGNGGLTTIAGGIGGGTGTGGGLTLLSGAGGGTSGNSGAVILGSAAETGTDLSGTVTISSGTAATANTGAVSFMSGVATTGNSGTAAFGSGLVTTGDSGALTISSGNATTGASGVINIATGTASTTVGVINFKPAGTTTVIFSTVGNNYGAQTGLTATAGGAQSGYALVKEYSNFTVVATAADSAQLPASSLGHKMVVQNSADKAMAIFGQTGDSIDGGSANVAVSLNPGCSATFERLSATAWRTLEGITGAQTQITTNETGVTLNARKGLITTVSMDAGAAGATPKTFVVTNSFAVATSNIRAYVVDYAGTIATNGNPFVQVDNRTAGAFSIIVSNAHGTNALSGVMVIGFEIVS